jgi:urate oxidase
MHLGANCYGKGEVRLVKVVRMPGRHELRDLTVHVALEGEFDAAHVTGDNTDLLATDTMRNTVYALAKTELDGSIETFARRLAEHFVAAGPSVTRARVRIEEHAWDRLGAHEHAFQRGSGGTRVCTVCSDGAPCSGIEDLLVLKTTGSGWEGYLREQYTSLPETDDRILCTVVSASWDYAGDVSDYDAAWEAARDAILSTFGDHYSPSVQYTLYRLGEAVLSAVPEIERIRFSLPNRHHLSFDLSRFGLENDHEIFHATTEPYGLIEGTVERSALAPDSNRELAATA